LNFTRATLLKAIVNYKKRLQIIKITIRNLKMYTKKAEMYAKRAKMYTFFQQASKAKQVK